MFNIYIYIYIYIYLNSKSEGAIVIHDFLISRDLEERGAKCYHSNLKNILNVATSKTDNRLESLERDDIDKLLIDMKVAYLNYWVHKFQSSEKLGFYRVIRRHFFESRDIDIHKNTRLRKYNNSLHVETGRYCRPYVHLTEATVFFNTVLVKQ